MILFSWLLNLLQNRYVLFQAHCHLYVIKLGYNNPHVSFSACMHIVIFKGHFGNKQHAGTLDKCNKGASCMILIWAALELLGISHTF